MKFVCGFEQHLCSCTQSCTNTYRSSSFWNNHKSSTLASLQVTFCNVTNKLLLHWQKYTEAQRALWDCGLAPFQQFNLIQNSLTLLPWTLPRLFSRGAANIWYYLVYFFPFSILVFFQKSAGGSYLACPSHCWQLCYISYRYKKVQRSFIYGDHVYCHWISGFFTYHIIPTICHH